MDGVRILRLGRQRPALHGMGRHGRALRPDHRLERGALVGSNAEHRIDGSTALVPDRRARQPARRDVVPDRPARLRRAHPEEVARHPARPRERGTGRKTTPLPFYSDRYDEVFEELPANFGDDLTPNPKRTGSGARTSSTASGATSIPSDKKAWLRHLDYYVQLHRLADRVLGTVLERARRERRVGRHRRHLHVRSR